MAMNTESHVTLSRGAALLLGFGLLAAGAGAVYVWTRLGPETKPADTAPVSSHAPGGQPPSSDAPVDARAIETTGAPLPDVVLTLTEDAVARAGIVVTSAAASTAAGLRMRHGQTIAQVYSPELAEAQTQYLALTAELEAAHHQLVRTERLLEIGAASRQELERIRAEHASHASHVAGARSRLMLLGMTAAQVERLSAATEISATVDVPRADRECRPERRFGDEALHDCRPCNRLGRRRSIRARFSEGASRESRRRDHHRVSRPTVAG
jgi:hypothetical protein